MEAPNQIRLPRLNLVHLMIVTAVVSIVFGVLTSEPLESEIGIAAICALLSVWFFCSMLRPNPLKQVLANLPFDPDQQIAALEHGLDTCNPYDRRTNATARYRLMKLYQARERYEDAITQGRAVLRMRGLGRDLEIDVRRAIAACLDVRGRPGEAALERMAAGDSLDDYPESIVG
jgi:hypothetical protein